MWQFRALALDPLAIAYSTRCPNGCRPSTCWHVPMHTWHPACREDLGHLAWPRARRASQDASGPREHAGACAKGTRNRERRCCAQVCSESCRSAPSMNLPQLATPANAHPIHNPPTTTHHPLSSHIPQATHNSYQQLAIHWHHHCQSAFYFRFHFGSGDVKAHRGRLAESRNVCEFG